MAILGWLPDRVTAQQNPPCCPGECCPTSLVVPFAAGGPTDVVGRAVAKALGPQLKVTVVVENKSGAGGIVGADAVARGSKKGEQALLATNAVLMTSLLSTKSPFRFNADLRPIAMLGSAPFVLLVPADSPVRSPKELVQALKSASDTKKYASPGSGTASHFAAELYLQSISASASHVPFRGLQAALDAFAFGQIAFGFFDAPTALDAIRQGKVRALGVSSSGRSKLLPDTPPLREQGQPDFEAVAWYGIFTATGVPDASAQRWQTAVTGALEGTDLRNQLELLGIVPQLLQPEPFRQFLALQTSKWADVAKKSSMRLE